MAKVRPAKYYRLNFANTKPGAFMALYGDPNEVRIGANEKSFISVKEGGITLSPGLPGKIMLQGMPGCIKYAGLISDIPFPMSLIPSPFTPKQIFTPPIKEMMDLVRTVSTLTGSFVGM